MLIWWNACVENKKGCAFLVLATSVKGSQKPEEIVASENNYFHGKQAWDSLSSLWYSTLVEIRAAFLKAELEAEVLWAGGDKAPVYMRTGDNVMWFPCTTASQRASAPPLFAMREVPRGRNLTMRSPQGWQKCASVTYEAVQQKIGADRSYARLILYYEREINTLSQRDMDD